jgi:hypothetical protein
MFECGRNLQARLAPSPHVRPHARPASPKPDHQGLVARRRRHEEAEAAQRGTRQAEMEGLKDEVATLMAQDPDMSLLSARVQETEGPGPSSSSACSNCGQPWCSKVRSATRGLAGLAQTPQSSGMQTRGMNQRQLPEQSLPPSRFLCPYGSQSVGNLTEICHSCSCDPGSRGGSFGSRGSQGNRSGFSAFLFFLMAGFAFLF